MDLVTGAGVRRVFDLNMGRWNMVLRCLEGFVLGYHMITMSQAPSSGFSRTLSPIYGSTFGEVLVVFQQAPQSFYLHRIRRHHFVSLHLLYHSAEPCQPTCERFLADRRDLWVERCLW
jgi:hypothetical protein